MISAINWFSAQQQKSSSKFIAAFTDHGKMSFQNYLRESLF